MLDLLRRPRGALVRDMEGLIVHATPEDGSPSLWEEADDHRNLKPIDS